MARQILNGLQKNPTILKDFVGKKPMQGKLLSSKTMKNETFSLSKIAVPSSKTNFAMLTKNMFKPKPTLVAGQGRRLNMECPPGSEMGADEFCYCPDGSRAMPPEFCPAADPAAAAPEGPEGAGIDESDAEHICSILRENQDRITAPEGYTPDTC